MALRRVPLVLGIVVALLAAVSSGCGSSGIAVPELTSFAQATEASSAADTARFELALDATVPGLGKQLSFGAEGAFDTPTRRAQLAVDLSSLAELLKSIGGNLGGLSQADLGSSDDWKLEVIQDGDTAYVHFPPLAKQLPAGKSWVKGSASELAKGSPGELSQFGSLAGTDPRGVFDLLKAVSSSIEAVGSEEVRGVDTAHYRATVDTTKLQELVPASQRQSLGGLDEAAKQSGVTEVPLDVWIDEQQRVRKLSVDLDAKQPGSGQSIKAALVAEFFDYGKPLGLELPPADQVVDAATLKKQTP